MYYLKAGIFGFGLPGAILMGAVHPVLGWISLACWLFVLLPMFWRAQIIHTAEVDEKRRRANIEAQLIRGRLDAKLIAETANGLRREGRL